MSSADYQIKAILDTSVYIPFLRDGIIHPKFPEDFINPLLYMSSVVVSELFAGAHDSQSIKLLDKLHQTFQNVGRLIVPNDEDWRQTGGIIAKSRKKYGYDSTYLSRLQNDILVACSARRIGAFVLTKNEKDFVRIREFVNFRIYGQ
ncbi:MAG: type II toxin-antitoxin system VapC family toxin [Nitrospirae bacterium]|nr:type II toxin-antitoxin system VapC family toxin [Nitrospirota bacterium]